MQNAPYNYNTIYEEGDFDVEYMVEINGVQYEQDKIWEMKTSRKAFSENNPMIGCAMVGQVDIQIFAPKEAIPRKASVKPHIRLRSRKRYMYSGWLQKGEFFIDTRDEDDSDDIDLLDIHGYDAMRKASVKYPSSNLIWDDTHPYADEVVLEIAGFMFDGDTSMIESETMNKLRSRRRLVNFPAQYTLAETLGSIGAMYGGNFIISDSGRLQLVSMFDLPKETYYLINEKGKYITFGGTRILLRTGV